MIKIKPYTELPQKEEIFNLYLYLASKAMPFYPEDVFLEGYCFPDGHSKTALSIYKSERKPRRRTESYKSILKKYRIPQEDTAEKKIKCDALLAKKIIRANSKELYKFLYKTNKRKKGKKTGHVNPDNLRKLLTVSVGHDGIKELPFVADAVKAGIEEKKEMLKHVFRYEDVFRSQGEIYRLVSLLGVEICPYCNRLFITTIASGDKKMSPQLDHYRSKSQYPFLALSIMNLVPSCSVCNHIKGDTSLEILYPYEEEMGKRCSFSVDAEGDLTALTGTRINHENLTIQLKQSDEKSSLGQRIKASIDQLNLKKVYQSHRGYVSDLLLQRYIFTDEMVKDIRNSFPNLFKSEKEVREMLLLNKLDQEHWGDYPLGKLTHDISEELDFLYAKSKA